MGRSFKGGRVPLLLGRSMVYLFANDRGWYEKLI